jgi:peptidoglycan/LPS O-acetylase OafA/YrhL
MLGLTFVTLLVAVDQLEPSRSLRNGIWAALAQVANWFDLLRGNSYADLFAAPSPIAHYWSLAIEEQFYWLWPPLLLGLVRAVRHRRPLPTVELLHRLRPLVLLLFVVTAVSAPLTANWGSTDAAYLATWARAAEILAGAVLAILTRTGVATARLAPLAAPALIAIVGLAFVTPAGRGWAYAGGLPLYAVVTAVLLAALQRATVVSRLLSLPPLVAVGKVSYGLYVFHWPLIVWLTPERVGFGGFGLGVVRLAAASAMAALSYLLLEHPIRTRSWFAAPPHLAPIVVASTATMAVLALLVPSPPALPPAAPPVLAAPPVSTTLAAPAPPSSTSPSSTAGVSPGTDPPAPVPTSPAATVATPRVVAVFGDSIPAWLLRDAAPTYARTDVVVVNGAAEACDGYDGAVVGRDRRGKELAAPIDCLGWPDSYPGVLSAGPRLADVAVLMIGTLPTLDRQVDGVWHAPCEGIRWYLDDVAARVDWLAAQGVRPILAVPARPGRGATFVAPDDVGERIDCIREQLFQFAAANELATIDLDLVLCPDGACDETRVDGVHVKPELAGAVLDWILDRTLDLDS